MLFTLVIAIFMGFTTTEIMAACTSPECFSANGCEISIIRGSDGEFPLVVNSNNATTEPYSNYASLDPARPFPYAVFAYKFDVTCKYSGLAQALQNPADPTGCPTNPFNILHTEPPEATWQEAGVGDVSNNWYVGDNTKRVLTWPSALPTNAKGFFFVTNIEVSPAAEPIILRSDNKTFYGSLLTADCWVPPPPIASTQNTFTWRDHEGTEFFGRITRNQNGEFTKVEVCLENALVDCDDNAWVSADTYPISTFRFGIPDDACSFADPQCWQDPGTGVWYKIHETADATDLGSVIGTTTPCPWFIKPPGIWINPCGN